MASVARGRALSVAASTSTERATGRQAWALLWSGNRGVAAGVVAWVIASTLTPALVVIALGLVVSRVPAAVDHGMNSSDGHRLVEALVVAGVIFGFSLVLDPVASALGTAARARVTGALQQRLLTAVSQPAGVAHLEDPGVLDRLARAEGSLTGFFPGDAPVTWAGILASRASGIVGCVVIAAARWWLGLLLLVIWLSVRKIMVGAIVRQATELRGQTSMMRRAWYFAGVGTKARDAKEVRVFGLGDFFAERFRGEHLQALRRGASGLRGIHRRAVACFVIVFATYAAALTTIAEEARTHSLDLRALATLLPMLAVTMSTGNVSFDDITLAWTLTGLPDVHRLESDLTHSREDLPGADRVDDVPQHSVRFESVHFRYPTGAVDVLAGLNLTLAAGRSTALVGVNGAGKSTIVSLLARLRDPTSGRISVDGTDVRELDAARWQRAVALMSQSPARYPVSAYDNVAFGAVEFRDDHEGVEAAARMAGFLDIVDTLPDRWETLLSRQLRGGVDLSGGQWQRLALARALFATRHGARLLVLDEPTAALDVRSEAQFYGNFLEITKGLTTLVISHRFGTVRRADLICVLDGGRIVERGNHDELVATGGEYARMYAVQAARFGAPS